MCFFTEYLANPRAYQVDHYKCVKHVWCNNSSLHNVSLELMKVLTQNNTQICNLALCSTSLVQLVDQFVIAKIKDAWS